MFQMTKSEFAEWCEITGHPGDLVMFDYKEDTPTSWALDRCQVRMLKQLVKSKNLVMSKEDIAKAAANTHAGMITNGRQLVEMTRPECRIIEWKDKLNPGDILTIRRPVIHLDGQPERDIDIQTGSNVAATAVMDVGKKYPTKEIIRYWVWSFGWRRLTLNTTFVKVFEDPENDVCSDSCWKWANKAKVWKWEPGDPEQIPAGHYPAELMINHRLRTVLSVEITA